MFLSTDEKVADIAGLIEGIVSTYVYIYAGKVAMGTASSTLLLEGPLYCVYTAQKKDRGMY